MAMREEDKLGTQVRSASGLNIAAGAWLIIAPFLLAYSDVAEGVWNDVIVGLAVLAFASYRVARPGSGIGLSWTNALLGGWLIIAPFALGYSDVTAAVWNDVIVGVVVVSLAIWSAAVGGRLHKHNMMEMQSGRDEGHGRAA
jgi:VIT1/CCC1 family predicted Fe2+/Mn2+ transporter